VKNKPPYALESVDNALRLLHLLRDQGGVRVSEVASELGVARSTAHRLLTMLVYRDFATKDDDHTYGPGPALSAPRLGARGLPHLRRLVRPYMDTLCERVSETINLMVRVGMQTRFLCSVECTQLLRVGDRQGTILPAWQSSGGKALLARLTDEQLTDLFSSDHGTHPSEITNSERIRLFNELPEVRRKGYAQNIEQTEPGVAAIGMCICPADGNAVAALSISAPSVRYNEERALTFARELRHTVRQISHDPGWGWLDAAS
jgi:DNA-binding IclR family transcriptional regulator